MKILFITYHFAPYNHIGAVRCSKTAKYLTQAGDEVRVITAADKPLLPTLDLEIAPEYVRELACPHLDRIAHSVSDRTPAVTGKGAATSAKPHIRVLRHLYNMYKQLTWYPDNIAGWKKRLTSAALEEIEQFQPDVILASGPPYTPFIAASEASRRTGVPWICELRDLWVDNHNYPYSALRRKFEEKLEYQTLSNASAFITVSEPLAVKLQKKYTAPVNIVPNGFDLADYPERDESLFSSDAVHLVYTGNIYKGKQNIQPLLEALVRANRDGPCIILHLYGRALGEAVAQAQSLGISDYVKYHGTVPYRQSLATQRSADALVMLNWNDPEETGVYSGKLFEYLGARRPILCVGSNKTVASDLILARNAGWLLSDPAELASVLIQLYDQKKLKGGIKDLSDEAIAGFTRYEQTLAIRDIMIQAVRARKG